jgi:hypothetical protein
LQRHALRGGAANSDRTRCRGDLDVPSPQLFARWLALSIAMNELNIEHGEHGPEMIGQRRQQARTLEQEARSNNHLV